MRTLTFLLLLMGISGTALAQEIVCPNGIPAANNPGCIPPENPMSPYYEGGMEQQQLPDPQLETLRPSNIPVHPLPGTWGAIVESPEGGIYVAWGEDDGATAQESAMQNCHKDFPANGCSLVAASHLADVALAYDGERYFMARGDIMNFKKPIAQAIDDCRKGARANNCQIALLFNPIVGPISPGNAETLEKEWNSGLP